MSAAIRSRRIGIIRELPHLRTGTGAEARGTCGRYSRGRKKPVREQDERRATRLLDELALVARAFEDFESLVVWYVQAVPLRPFGVSSDDAENMLQWLTTTLPLNPSQRDHIECHRARHMIELLACQHRTRHLRFQQLWRSAPAQLYKSPETAQCRLLLNPIRTWVRLTTGDLFEDEATAPVDVLFFGRGGQVACALVELEGQALLNELADYQPCTLRQWGGLTRLAGLGELMEFCSDLSRMGLLATQCSSGGRGRTFVVKGGD